MAPKPRKVMTPGSQRTDTGTGTPTSRKRSKAGRPGQRIRKKRILASRHRAAYTEDDVLEAIRLVKEEEYCIKAAAKLLNDRKQNEVPRMTLSDRLHKPNSDEKPSLGRPIRLSPAVEKALVKCLTLCAEFQYPMKKRDLQVLVITCKLELIPVPILV